ncbi:MAG TPA: VOC family protein [Micromonosporaceae bacterium]
MIATLRTVVLDAPDPFRLAQFYADLAGWTQRGGEPDFVVLTSPDGWRFGMQLAPDHVPPRWPDPAYPQQAHLDLLVADVETAAKRAITLGARPLAVGASWRTLADPAGHPFDLCHNPQADPDNPAEAMKMYAVTLDTGDAARLSQFYAQLLGLDVRFLGDEGALIGRDDQPQIMFQQISDYRPPRWPDPSHPQQFHLDATVTDVDSAQAQALDLGATRLAFEGENWRVFADPDGHPFCLCWDL